MWLTVEIDLVLFKPAFSKLYGMRLIGIAFAGMYHHSIAFFYFFGIMQYFSEK